MISECFVILYGGAEVEIHKVKIDRLPFDPEKIREGAQLAKAELFIECDGAFVVAAHFKIDLFYPGFTRKIKHAVCQNGRRARSPTMLFSG